MMPPKASAMITGQRARLCGTCSRFKLPDSVGLLTVEDLRLHPTFQRSFDFDSHVSPVQCRAAAKSEGERNQSLTR